MGNKKVVICVVMFLVILIFGIVLNFTPYLSSMYLRVPSAVYIGISVLFINVVSPKIWSECS